MDKEAEMEIRNMALLHEQEDENGGRRNTSMMEMKAQTLAEHYLGPQT